MEGPPSEGEKARGGRFWRGKDRRSVRAVLSLTCLIHIHEEMLSQHLAQGSRQSERERDILEDSDIDNCAGSNRVPPQFMVTWTLGM